MAKIWFVGSPLVLLTELSELPGQMGKLIIEEIYSSFFDMDNPSTQC